MTQAAIKTGVGPMVTVAVEQHFPEDQRIIVDNLAYAILPFAMRAFVLLTKPDFVRDWMIRATEKSAPGIWGGLMCRKRYIDEKLVESAGQIEAIVNLGAGFDTRTCRLPKLAGIPVWELDHHKNIKPKRMRLRKLFGALPANIQLVSIDFDCEDLETKLAAQNYALNKPTFFIWEAVTQYLDESGINMTFDFLAKAARGSRLAFTYIRQDFIDGRVLYGQEKLYQQYIVKNRIWQYGLDPQNMANFLDNYGWRFSEHIGYEELAARYVKPTGRQLAATPIERMVYAEKR